MPDSSLFFFFHFFFFFFPFRASCDFREPHQRNNRIYQGKGKRSRSLPLVWSLLFPLPRCIWFSFVVAVVVCLFCLPFFSLFFILFRPPNCCCLLFAFFFFFRFFFLPPSLTSVLSSLSLSFPLTGHPCAGGKQNISRGKGGGFRLRWFIGKIVAHLEKTNNNNNTNYPARGRNIFFFLL